MIFVWFVQNINWSSVAENFMADFAVAALFGFLLIKFLEWRKRSKLKLVINLENTLLAKENIYWASIIIANNGRSALREKEINWHIYWSYDSYGEFFEIDRYPFEYAGHSEINGERVSHIRNFNAISLFPEREIQILRFRFKKQYAPSQIRVRYHFSTAIGLKPRWVWNGWRYTKLQDKSKSPKLYLLPIAEVR